LAEEAEGVARGGAAGQGHEEGWAVEGEAEAGGGGEVETTLLQE
jgi:hypothetical protein